MNGFCSMNLIINLFQKFLNYNEKYNASEQKKIPSHVVRFSSEFNIKISSPLMNHLRFQKKTMHGMWIWIYAHNACIW